MRQSKLVQKASFVGFCILFIIMMETGVCFAAASCNFTQATTTVPFGNLDPFSTANATSTVTLGVSCSGNPRWFMTSDNGLYYNGATKRMRHQTELTEYLPYTMTFVPTTGNKFVTTIAGIGMILNSSYSNVYFGNYSDSVTLTITP
jgi:spore coat protein U-like protein